MMKYIKDDFSLDFVMNGKRELSYEYGNLNGVEAIFESSGDGKWYMISLEDFDTEQIPDLKMMELNLAESYPGTNTHGRKGFYPKSAKVGDVWALGGNDLKWVLDGASSEYEATGNMTLKEVLATEDDSVAIIDLNLRINYVSVFDPKSPPLKKQLNFSGTVFRSLVDFIDRKTELNGSYVIKRVKPKQTGMPRLDIDIQANGTLLITEEFLDKKK